MEIIPQLISRYSVVLYAVCAIACAYFILTGFASLRELRRALFKLERNAVVQRAISALLKAVLCVIIAAGVYLVASLAPPSRAEDLLGAVTSTPNNVGLATPMPTAVITAGQALASESFTPTITFLDASGTPTGTTALPGQAATPPPRLVALALQQELQPDCADPIAQITSPAPDERVVGTYVVRGTALLEEGDSYRLEILVPGAALWAFISRGETSVSGGVLYDSFSAGNFAPGVYPLRLALLREDGTSRAICRIPMTIGP